MKVKTTHPRVYFWYLNRSFTRKTLAIIYLTTPHARSLLMTWSREHYWKQSNSLEI